jgi:hypothetical protein
MYPSRASYETIIDDRWNMRRIDIDCPTDSGVEDQLDSSTIVNVDWTRVKYGQLEKIQLLYIIWRLEKIVRDRL